MTNARDTNKNHAQSLLFGELREAFRDLEALAATSGMEGDRYEMRGTGLAIRDRLRELAPLVEAVIAL